MSEKELAARIATIGALAIAEQQRITAMALADVTGLIADYIETLDTDDE
jgi:hypothetical protein